MHMHQRRMIYIQIMITIVVISMYVKCWSSDTHLKLLLARSIKFGGKLK